MILDIEMPNYNLRKNEKSDLGQMILKAQAIEKNLKLLVENPNAIERICLDLSQQFNEYGLLNYDGEWENQIEVLTKEQAKQNDLDELCYDTRYDKNDLKNYRVGKILSSYKKLGESNYYYREL